jgi:hypothetical protein
LIDKNSRKTYMSLMEVEKTSNIRPVYVGGIRNDLDGGISFQPGGASARQESYFVENGREYIIGLYDAYRFKALLNNVEFINNVPEFPQKKIEFEKFAKTINETDNPVFMIIRLKN